MVSRRKAIAGAFRHLQDRKIIIAPGHVGYKGIGARVVEGLEVPGVGTNPDSVRLPLQYSGLFCEEQLNTMVAVQTLLILEHAGANARDCEGTFAYKACVAQGWQPEAFVEIHCNSSAPTGNGVEVWHDGDKTSVALSVHLLSFLVNYSGLASRGLKDMESEDNAGTWKDQHDALFEHMPVQERGFPLVLIECGFLSDPGDAAFLIDPANHEKLATAICHGLDVFFESTTDGPGAGGSSPYDSTG